MLAAPEHQEMKGQVEVTHRMLRTLSVPFKSEQEFSTYKLVCILRRNMKNILTINVG